MTKKNTVLPFNFNDKTKQIISAIIGLLLIATIIGVMVAIFAPSTTKTIPTSAWRRGSINTLGVPVESDKSIYTKDMFACQGLEISVDDGASVEYVVYYYDAERNYLGKSAKQTGDYVGDNSFAKYARVVLTPKGADTTSSDFKIGLFDVRDYAKLITVSVLREQGGVWSRANLITSYDNVAFLSVIYDGKYWIATTDNGKILYSSNAKEWNASQFSITSSENEFEDPSDGNGGDDSDGNSGSTVASVSSTVASSSVDHNIVSITYGGGMYVAIDSAQCIYVSDAIHDGWQLKYTAENLNSVVYGNNQYVAVGDEGQVISSADGLTWSQISYHLPSNLYDIVYEGSYYVVAGADGYIYFAPDLTQWMYSRVDDMDRIETLFYDDGTYYAGGANGKIAISTELSVWALCDVMSTSSIESVTDFASHDGKLFATVCTRSGKGEVWMSDDGGYTWNVVFTANTRLYSIESNQNVMVMCGSSGTIYYME